MLRIHSVFAAGLMVMGFTGIAAAQRYTSPPASTTVTIVGKQITVDYYAPSAHGRKIMGSLVPFGEVWCPGANVATGLTTTADLQIGGLKLPKGTWSIWAIPGEKEWTLIVNKQSGQFHLDYDQSQDFGRTKMTVKALSSAVETFTIALSSNGGSKGTLALSWENTEASIPFTVLP